MLKAALFRKEARELRFEPRTGMRVLAHGSVSLYSAGGSLQVYLDRLEPGGGALALAFQQLVARLEARDSSRRNESGPCPSCLDGWRW